MVTYFSLPKLHEGYVYNCCDTVENKLFVIGGCNIKGQAQKISQYIDLTKRDKYVQIADLPRIKAGSTAIHIGKKLITIGGIYDKNCQLDNVDIFDIDSQTWCEAAILPHPVQGASVFVRDNVIYCAGGVSTGMNSLPNFQMLDLSCGNWQILPEMSTARFSSGHFLHNDSFYVIGGRDHKAFSGACECFDFRAGKWRTLPPIPNEYKNVFNGFVKTNDYAFVIGGLNEVATKGFSNIVYKFNLTTENWEKAPNLLKPRADFGVHVVDDKIVVAGGLGQLQGLAISVETFDLKRNKWSLADDLPNIHASSSKCVSDRSLFLVSGMGPEGVSNNVTEVRI